MDMGRYLVEAHLREGRPVAELAKTHGVHRSWIYKLLTRYRAEGEAGLASRSRRPRSSPGATPAETEDRILTIRKRLSEEGLDAGAVTIAWHLARQDGPTPSVSTIWRILKRAGFVTPQPAKRPRSSYVRFAAELPNECWQTDMTHWSLSGGRRVEIVNFLDDHSRLCVASVAVAVTRATDVAEIFQAARILHGTPASVLSDNGCIYTARHRGGKVVLETELERLGVTFKHSRPYHPQTCGKVERFHQTLKRYLARQPAATDLSGLQVQIDRFVSYYNTERPHRGIGRRTPREVFDSRIKAHPSTSGEPTNFRVRRDRVSATGNVTLRYEARLFHIGVGRRWAGRTVHLLVAHRDVRVVTEEGELVRMFTLDPTRNYQRQKPG
jgi:transposase InsO family protein